VGVFKTSEFHLQLLNNMMRLVVYINDHVQMQLLKIHTLIVNVTNSLNQQILFMMFNSIGIHIDSLRTEVCSRCVHGKSMHVSYLLINDSASCGYKIFAITEP